MDAAANVAGLARLTSISGRFSAIAGERLLLRADRGPCLGGNPLRFVFPQPIESAFEGTELVLIAPIVENATFEQGAEDLLLERIVEGQLNVCSAVLTSKFGLRAGSG